MKHLKPFTQFVNENVDWSQLKELEAYADSLFNELGLDVVFTKHFENIRRFVRKFPGGACWYIVGGWSS